jgi:hypothetical protein
LSGQSVSLGKTIEVTGLSSRKVKFLLRKFLYVNHLSGYGVLDTAGSFEIVHIKPETREEEEKREPLKPTISLLPLYHPVNPSDSIEWQGQGQPRNFSIKEKVKLQEWVSLYRYRGGVHCQPPLWFLIRSTTFPP